VSDPRVGAVLAELEAIEPCDEREDVSKAEVLRLLPELEHPFDEDGDPRHLTASALIVGTRGIVLHRHRKLDIWVQPGGHIDEGETPFDAAGREASEETGLVTISAFESPRIFHVDVHTGPREHLHLDLRYLLLAPADEPNPGEGESPDVLWVDFATAQHLAHWTMHGALKKAERAWHGHERSWREKVVTMRRDFEADS
jgi:8-oxo-dGTP pyrophosphatase MutT (NUDIX family)